ncbi:MAG TPA: hypothetical protein VF719_12115, partial [Abditibacteriaceae bacterium]
NWGAQRLLYEILQLGGLSGMVIVRSLCAGVAFALVVSAAFRRAARIAASDEDDTVARPRETTCARVTAIAAFLAFGMIAMNLDARPQMFALPLFGAGVWLLFEWPHFFEDTNAQRVRGWVSLAGVGALILTVLWANLHGSFFLAPLLFGCTFAGETLYHAVAPKKMHFGEPLPLFARRTLGALTIMCTVAIALNPRRFGLFAYVAKMSTNNTIQKFILEWQPPSFGEGGSIVFFASTLLAGALLVLMARRVNESVSPVWGVFGVRAGEVLFATILLLMALRNMRSILWFALLFVPLFTGIVTQYLRGRETSGDAASDDAAKSTAEFREPATPRRAQIINTAILAVLCFLAVPVLPQFKANLNWPSSFRARFAPTPPGEFPSGFGRDPQLILDRSTPVEAVAFLQSSPPRRKLWNDMGFGSYLVWALHPQTKVGTDPRIEMYSEKYWLDYLRLSAGPADAATQLKNRGVSDALLDREAQAGLITRLRAAPDWIEIPLPGGPAVLFRRRPPRLIVEVMRANI